MKPSTEGPALDVVLAAIVSRNGLPAVLEALANLEAQAAQVCLRRSENREAYDRSLAAKALVQAANYIAKGSGSPDQGISPLPLC